MALTEHETRGQLIDRQLELAGWRLDDRTQVRREVPADNAVRYTSDIEYKAGSGGITDDCLYDEDGCVLSVVECKRTSRNPREGEEQLRLYVARVAKNQPFSPFGFMANGLTNWFWEVGLAHPRMVAGFFTRADLKRFRFIRQNRQPLAAEVINPAIVDRPYQHEAIRRVAEAFTAGKRRALLVMATGTGKTRTAMGLIDIFLRTHWAQKILFVADRDALVEQALNDGFKAHLPHEPRVRIHTASIDQDKRLYVATLQTMARCFERFSPGFFDLIIFDEAHRSIFNRFTEVIEYFDARMIGLTATPAAFIDRDTFRTFDCHDQLPTFLYPYPQAVSEKRLVDFRLYQAQTSFQRKGIKGADLSEEDRNTLFEQGLDPDQIDFSGTDMEVLVSNRDTLRRQWEEIMNVCIKDRGGHLPGKTIIFAMTKDHADRIRDVFEELFPEHVGLLQVIHHGMERVHDGPYGDGLITQFKKLDKPRIAVSVDMLDTGVDIPEVVNLVFMKPVQSCIKLWQMIGRGTRNQEACRFFDRLPEGKKEEFLIIDFWQNDFGKQTEERGPTEMPVLVRLFNTRLDILTTTITHPGAAAHQQAVADCRAMLSRVPVDSFLVRKVWGTVAVAWEDASFWQHITADKINFLRLKVAPLLRLVPDVDVSAETFANKVERLNLQIIRGQPSPDLLQSIAEDVSLLPPHVLSDAVYAASVKLATSSDLAQATPPQLKKLVEDLAGQMKNKRRLNSFLTIDLPDFIAGKNYVLIGTSGQPVHVEEYRKRVEACILALTETHPALVAIREGREPSSDALVDLERALHNELTGAGIQLSAKTARQAYGVNLDNRSGFLGFVRHVLDIDAIPNYEAVVAAQFQNHITRHNYSGDQIRFLRAVQDVFLTKNRLSEADLYEAPLTSFGRNAVDRFFSPDEIKEIVALAEHVAA
ncbi:MAG: DEAD/DEAH box helicase family protein [bacterium]